MKTQRLPYDFFARDTIAVARALLGKRLIHRQTDGALRVGRIVETEAYLGIEDPAAHSFAGRRTARTEVMFGAPGVSYIYFVYGMHFCLNIVTARKEVPEAVLLRALAFDDAPAQTANGPGKLCRALRLDLRHNALDLTRSRVLWLEDDAADVDVEILEGPRVGVDYAGDAAYWPLRFGLKGHPALSPTKFIKYLE